MRASRWTLGILVGALVIGCGSARTAARRTTASATTAYVSEVAPINGPYLSRPSTVVLSGDGDLVAVHLKWTDWGSPVTYAQGTFLFRVYPSNARSAVAGTLTLSEQLTCGSKLYYEAGVIRAPGAPFRTSPTTPFRTPCGTGAG